MDASCLELYRVDEGNWEEYCPNVAACGDLDGSGKIDSGDTWLMYLYSVSLGYTRCSSYCGVGGSGDIPSYGGYVSVPYDKMSCDDVLCVGMKAFFGIQDAYCPDAARCADHYPLCDSTGKALDGDGVIDANDYELAVKAADLFGHDCNKNVGDGKKYCGAGDVTRDDAIQCDDYVCLANYVATGGAMGGGVVGSNCHAATFVECGDIAKIEMYNYGEGIGWVSCVDVATIYERLNGILNTDCTPICGDAICESEWSETAGGCPQDCPQKSLSTCA